MLEKMFVFHSKLFFSKSKKKYRNLMSNAPIEFLFNISAHLNKNLKTEMRPMPEKYNFARGKPCHIFLCHFRHTMANYLQKCDSRVSTCRQDQGSC